MVKNILFVVLFLVVGCSVFAAEDTYTGADNGAWEVAGNWSLNAAPTLSDIASLQWGTTVVISADAYAKCIRTTQWFYNSNGVIQNGGTVTLEGDMSFLGVWTEASTSNGHGTYVLNDGCLLENTSMTIGGYILGTTGIGTFVQNGGTAYFAALGVGYGSLVLNDGVMDADLIQAWYGPAGQALTDIYAGTLRLPGNQVDWVDTLVTDGRLKGYGGTGTVNRYYDEDLEKTIVTAAIPEPITLALFGLGGLVLTRRQRTL